MSLDRSGFGVILFLIFLDFAFFLIAGWFGTHQISMLKFDVKVTYLVLSPIVLLIAIGVYKEKFLAWLLGLVLSGWMSFGVLMYLGSFLKYDEFALRDSVGFVVACGNILLCALLIKHRDVFQPGAEVI